MLIQTAIDIFWQTPQPPLHEIDLPLWKESSPTFNESHPNTKNNLPLEQKSSASQVQDNPKQAFE